MGCNYIYKENETRSAGNWLPVPVWSPSAVQLKPFQAQVRLETFSPRARRIQCWKDSPPLRSSVSSPTPRLSAICRLTLLFVLLLAPCNFSPRTTSFKSFKIPSGLNLETKPHKRRKAAQEGMQQLSAKTEGQW